MVTQTATKPKMEVHTMPEGRLINHSFFVKDIYKDAKTGKEGKPSYKFEVAFDPKDVEGEGTIEDKIIDCVEAEWGAAAVDDYINFLNNKATKHTWKPTFLDGDKLAEGRADKGKEGDAYKDKLVLRGSTEFNRDSRNEPGGIAVFGPDVHKIGIVEGNEAEIFAGCYGKVAVALKAYEINGNRYVATYLSAFQKTRGADSDRLSTGSDKSTLFAPVGGGEATSGRRRRAG